MKRYGSLLIIILCLFEIKAINASFSPKELQIGKPCTLSFLLDTSKYSLQRVVSGKEYILPIKTITTTNAIEHIFTSNNAGKIDATQFNALVTEKNTQCRLQIHLYGN